LGKIYAKDIIALANSLPRQRCVQWVANEKVLDKMMKALKRKPKIHGRKYDKLPPKKVSDAMCFAEWRKQVYERDKFTCQLCGNMKSINAHHVMGKASKRMKYSVLNGVVLCAGCHLEGIHSDVASKAMHYLAALQVYLGENRWTYLHELHANKEPMSLVECWEALNGKD
jgi:transcription elongation factor Elf1